MLCSLKEFEGYHLAAEDGVFGTVDDVLFDDEHWTVRYLVVKTGPWLLGRKVLIWSRAVSAPDWENRTIRTTLTRDEIRAAPDFDTDAPVSRQRERELLAYYGWSPYWYPTAPVPIPADESADTHLRSLRAVTEYRVAGNDGDIGDVSDLIVDPGAWVIWFVAVVVGRTLAPRVVLVAPGWVGNIDWSLRRVQVSLSRQQIVQAPEYRDRGHHDTGQTPSLPVTQP